MTSETVEVTEEVQKETPSPQEFWSKLIEPGAKVETPPEVPEVVDEEPEEPEVEETKTVKAEPEDPLASDPKLAKRFRDSQAFISQLKQENRDLTNQVGKLSEQMKELSRSMQTAQTPQNAPVKQPSKQEVNDVMAEVMASLPDEVKDEVQTFPELFKGIDALIKHHLSSANKEIEEDIAEVRRSRRERVVQNSLRERHNLANSQLGITNAAQLDLDDGTFAQWVLSEPWRKNVVMDFENPKGFVDLLRSFFYEYPELAKSSNPHTPPVDEEQQKADAKRDERRKQASHSIPAKPVTRTPQKPKTVQTPDDKQLLWQQLTAKVS